MKPPTVTEFPLLLGRSRVRLLVEVVYVGDRLQSAVVLAATARDGYDLFDWLGQDWVLAADRAVFGLIERNQADPHEGWLWRNPEALAAVLRGLDEAQNAT